MLEERRQNLRNDSAFVLAFIFIVGFFGFVFLIMLRDVPKDSQNIVQQIVSIVSMIMSAMAGYFYGSSRSSANKDETIKQLTTQSVTSVPVQPPESPKSEGK